MKQEAWLKCVTIPDDILLKTQYQQLKAQSRKAVDKAHDVWWKPRQERLRSYMRLQ